MCILLGIPTGDQEHKGTQEHLSPLPWFILAPRSPEIQSPSVPLLAFPAPEQGQKIEFLVSSPRSKEPRETGLLECSKHLSHLKCPSKVWKPFSKKCIFGASLLAKWECGVGEKVRNFQLNKAISNCFQSRTISVVHHRLKAWHLCLNRKDFIFFSLEIEWKWKSTDISVLLTCH